MERGRKRGEDGEREEERGRWREGGREGKMERGRKRGEDGEREEERGRWREGGREGKMERGRKGGEDGEREGGEREERYLLEEMCAVDRYINSILKNN